MCAHTCTHAHAHARTHMHVQAHTRTHARTCTHTHPRLSCCLEITLYLSQTCVTCVSDWMRGRVVCVAFVTTQCADEPVRAAGTRRGLSMTARRRRRSSPTCHPTPPTRQAVPDGPCATSRGSPALCTSVTHPHRRGRWCLPAPQPEAQGIEPPACGKPWSKPLGGTFRRPGSRDAASASPLRREGSPQDQLLQSKSIAGKL